MDLFPKFDIVSHIYLGQLDPFRPTKITWGASEDPNRATFSKVIGGPICPKFVKKKTD